MLWLFIAEQSVCFQFTILFLGTLGIDILITKITRRMSDKKSTKIIFSTIFAIATFLLTVSSFFTAEVYSVHKVNEIRQSQTALSTRKLYISSKELLSFSLNNINNKATASFVNFDNYVLFKNVFPSDSGFPGVFQAGVYQIPVLSNNPDIISAVVEYVTEYPDDGLHLILETHKIGYIEKTFLVLDEDYYQELL